MRARHTRFNRIATTVVAGFAFASAVAGTSVLVLHNEGVIDINNPTPNIYKAEFYVDDVLVYQTKKIRGDEIGYGYTEMPTKDCDVDGQLYIFTGWDLTGNGIPDVLPNRIYANFRADATFSKFGIPDIDWSKVDFNKLLDLLQYLDIDLESFMNFFGLDWEDMLELLDVPVINYTTDYRGIVYLRNESFGKYNKLNHKWNNASMYPLDNISTGSVNPLEFAIDKASVTLGSRANVEIDLEYLKSGSNYPVMCYEKDNAQGLASDSISLTKPVDSKYHTTGLPYSFITSSMISILQNIPFSSKAIEHDEKVYREYAKEHYLDIDQDDKETILALLKEDNIEYDPNYRFVDKVTNFFKGNYQFDFRMPSYPLSCDPPMYFLTDAKVGIGRHFAAATTLVYRALGVPARYVQGYVDYAEDADVNTIAAIQAHSWCEIYVNGVGWVVVDSAISNITPEDLAFLFSTDNVDELDFEAPASGDIVDFKAYMKETEFEVGDVIRLEDIICRATYDDDGYIQEIRVTPTHVVYPDMSSAGDKVITVFYHENGEIFMEEIPIKVGGIIKGKIKLIPKEIAAQTYSGYAPYQEESLFTLVDDKDNSLVLREGDRAVFTPMFIGEDADLYSSLGEVFEAGDYDFRIRVDIYDSDGRNVTNDMYDITNNYSYSGDNKKLPIYRITINAQKVTLYTAGSSIYISSIDDDPYYGTFVYPYLSKENDISYSNAYVTLSNGQFIDVTKTTGWTTLSNVGSKRNDFDLDSIVVYGYDEYGNQVEMTANYEFSLPLANCKYITVKSDE